jgi:hypothetical protein
MKAVLALAAAKGRFRGCAVRLRLVQGLKSQRVPSVEESRFSRAWSAGWRMSPVAAACEFL